MKVRLIIILSFTSILYAQSSVLVLSTIFPEPQSKIKDNYLIHPLDVKMLESKYLVLDSEDATLKVFSNSGEYLFKFEQNSSESKLKAPISICVNKKDELVYCQDQLLNKVNTYGFDGEFIQSFKTFNPNKDIVFNDRYIYGINIGENKTTIFNSFFKKGIFQRNFGDFLSNVNDYRLYKGVLRVYNNCIYLGCQFLPYIIVYDTKTYLSEAIEIEDDRITNFCENNMEYAINKDNLKYWHLGFEISEGYIYIYDSTIKKILKISFNGDLVEEIGFAESDKVSIKRSLIFQMIEGDNFVFSDLNSSQIKIYKLLKKQF